MQQNNGDNWLVTNSVAILIPTDSTYTDRTHLVDRIGYRCTLIVFCLNRVKMFDDVFKRGLKRPNRPFIESRCGIGHIRFFQRG